MVSINKKAAGPKTHEGTPAARLTALETLRRSVLACLLWEDPFYEDGEQIGDRIARLAAEVKAEEVAALAVEAREQMKLRHAPLWLARGLAKRRSALVGPTLERVIHAYQLAKYDRRGMAIKLRDVMFLVHPKPKDAAQAATWKDLADGTLDTPDTWEVALSAGDDPRDTWTRLLAGRKLGALALLRNLRNMREAGVDLDLVREALRTMPVGRVLPFRFITAARHAPDLEPELEQAMLRAAADLPKLPGRTALVVDHSGSMTGAPVSRRSELDRFDAARALAMLAREQCEDVVIIVFGSFAKLVPHELRGFALAQALARGPGGGTNTEKAKRLADGEGYDRIVIITDEQSHQALSAPNGRGYVINVAPYEHGIGYGAWTHVDGWSEAALSYISAAESLGVQPVADEEE